MPGDERRALYIRQILTAATIRPEEAALPAD